MSSIPPTAAAVTAAAAMQAPQTNVAASAGHLQAVSVPVRSLRHDVIAGFLGFLPGAASGVTKCIVGHPFDTIKVRMQTEGGFGRFKGPMDCLVQTMKLEGIRGLYKGVTPPLIGWFIIDSVMWRCYLEMQTIIRRTNTNVVRKGGELLISEHAMAGAVAGVVSCVVVTPIEQVKARLQVQYHDRGSIQYSGPIDCMRKLVRNNGVRGLYKGFAGTVLFRLFISVYFAGYQSYLRLFRRKAVPEGAAIFLSGGLAASTLWLFAFPADVLKNRMMAQPDVKPRKYESLRQCISYIYKNEGYRGFFRGFVPCMLRSFPTNGAAFVAAEAVLRAIPARK